MNFQPLWLPYGVIAITCAISLMAWKQRAWLNQYCLHIGAIKQGNQWLRLISSGFLHIDTSHLLMNMMTLFFFGGLCVQLFGGWGFIGIYLGALLLGNIVTLLIHQRQTNYAAVGASGAISGILLATLTLKPRISLYLFFIPIPIAGWVFSIIYMGYSIFAIIKPQYGGNIGHSAHLGGAAFGLLYAVVTHPQIAQNNALYVGAMLIPLVILVILILRKQSKTHCD